MKSSLFWNVRQVSVVNKLPAFWNSLYAPSSSVKGLLDLRKRDR